jgi:peptide methionine sulfoxide reductase MsrB
MTAIIQNINICLNDGVIEISVRCPKCNTNNWHIITKSTHKKQNKNFYLNYVSINFSKLDIQECFNIKCKYKYKLYSYKKEKKKCLIM